jgi:hypothetical protein
MRGNEQDVIERQRLPDDTHAFLLCAKTDYTRVVPSRELAQARCAESATTPVGTAIGHAAGLTRGYGWFTLPLS